jgi:hypothetical protein
VQPPRQLSLNIDFRHLFRPPDNLAHGWRSENLPICQPLAATGQHHLSISSQGIWLSSNGNQRTGGKTRY